MSIDYKKFLFRKSLELNCPEIDDKQNSEIPVELKYHIKIVLLTLKDAFEKFKISLILPQIFENPRVLHQYLRSTAYQECLQLVKEYRKESVRDYSGIPFERLTRIEDLCKHQYFRSREIRPEPNQPDASEILKIIDYFQERHQMLNDLPNWIDDVDIRENYYLKAFEDVCQIAEERFQRSAITDLGNEKRLHVFYLANEETMDNLKKIKHKVQQKKIRLLWKHGAKSGVIQKLEEDLAFSQHNNCLFVKREMAKCQREIQRSNNAFVAKQQELEEDVKKAHLNYEAKLKTDLREEKIVQDEHNKVQLQLQALIVKYDQTIYDKHVEELLLQEECNKQKHELERVTKEYKKEEEIYEEVVVKQQQLQEAKASMLAYTNAAIIIQKWWRAKQRRIARQRAKQKRRDRAARKKKAAK